MNFYRHHLGDYARDTRHLSLLEHGAYRMLLDCYYTQRGPLRAIHVHRLVGARTRSERAAVDRVLSEFFERVGDVFRNARADREIAAYDARAMSNMCVAHDRERARRNAKNLCESKDGPHDSCTNRAPNQNPEEEQEQDQEQKPRSVAVSVAAEVGERGADAPRSGSSIDAPELELVAPPSDDAEAHLTSVTGARVPLSRSTLDRMAEAYPLVDVRGAVKRAALWLDANPKRRPTTGGMLRFLTTWLGRDQQRASEASVRGYQSARVIEGGRRESLCERAARLGAEGDARDARQASAIVAIGGGRA